MKIKIKKLSEIAQLPAYAKVGDAGMDLTAVSKNVTKDYIEYGTGLAVQIPEGYVGLVFPRSSVSKHSLLLCNSIGVIDSGYRGEIKLRFKKVPHDPAKLAMFPIASAFTADGTYEISDRIGQLMVIPYPTVQWEEVENLDETERGDGGFGSSGLGAAG